MTIMINEEDEDNISQLTDRATEVYPSQSPQSEIVLDGTYNLDIVVFEVHVLSQRSARRSQEPPLVMRR